MFLTNIRNQDPTRPSFFEMMAQTYFMPSLKPALHYMWTVLATRYPSKFYPVVKYSDEIFYAGLLLVNRRFLSLYDSTFAENFYGMERVRISGNLNLKLNRRDKLKCLVLTTIVPYLKEKLDKYYVSNINENAFDDEDEDGDGDDQIEELEVMQEDVDANWKRKLYNLFLKYYPHFNSVYEFLFFLFQVMYLYGKSQYFDPFLYLQRIAVKRINSDDMIEQETQKTLKRVKYLSSFNTSTLSPILTTLLKAYYFFTDYLQYILPLSIFFFKFLEWWYSEENVVSRKKEAPCPPPPSLAKKSPSSKVDIPISNDICPLCTKKRTNPALSVSGYLFCYPCIYNYVEENKKCPITFQPNNISQIRKIFEN